MAGRNLPLSISFTYNSQLWILNWLTLYYDPDQGFPAPGFSFPFPRLINQGSYLGNDIAVMLAEPDGTRHPYQLYVDDTCGDGCFWTTDGSFINYGVSFNAQHGFIVVGKASYPDGSSITFGRYGRPQKIEDAHGNYIIITYDAPALGTIQTITDTVGRPFMFHYDAIPYAWPRHLTRIVGPDLAGNQRDLVRFIYQTLSLPYRYSGHFNNSLTISAPSSVQVLGAVYYPATRTGYFLGGAYSTYGMLRGVVEQRNMVWQRDPTSDDGQGSITNAGQMSSQRIYDYPIGPPLDPPLLDAPTFGRQDIQWDRGPDGPGYALVTYDRQENDPRVVTVTNPDRTQVVQKSVNDAGTWGDGLVTEEYFYRPDGGMLRQTLTNWVQTTPLPGTDAGAPFRSSVTTYDAESGEKLKLDYGGAANSFFGQPLSIDYQQINGQTATSLRFIKFTYVNDWPSGPYATRRHLNLTQKVELFNSSAQGAPRLSETDYAYDTVAYAADRCNTDAGHEDLDTFYGNNKQGNVTQTIRYTQTDPSPDGGITENRTYDNNGNVVTVATCCDQVKYFYNDSNTHCAYPDAVRRGAADPNPPSVTIDAGYDLGAGVVVSTTDANGATTRFSYFSGSLRLQQVTLPAGGTHALAYDDVNLVVTSTDTADAGRGWHFKSQTDSPGLASCAGKKPRPRATPGTLRK